MSLAYTRTSVIVSERTDPRHHSIGRTWTVLRRITYRLFASRLVVQTGSVARWAKGWLPDKMVAVIPNAVRPFDLVRPVVRPPNMPSRNVIIGIGRLSREKGFDQLICAFAGSGLAKRGWSLVILGEGDARPELASLISTSGLSQYVFLPGVQANPDEWLRFADIFVLSSRYEGFPNVLIEAMQCGVASVAFNCESGPAEIIRHGVDGLLVPSGDVPALSDSLCQLVDNEALRNSLGEKAKDVLIKFSPERIYNKWQFVCESVIAESK